MPFVKRQRTYYKYEYQDWTQPVATADTTAIDGGNMVFTASSKHSTRKLYGPLDGLTSGSNNNWLPNGTASAWWQVKFPYKLKITGLTHYNGQAESSVAITSARFYTDSTMTTPIGDSFSTPNTDNFVTTISGIPAKGIITDTIYFSETSGGYGGIGELIITAQKQLPAVETTKEKAEWYVDNNKLYQLVKKGKHYFKTIYRVNTTKTGSPTINNCVVSGFSSSNYLSFPSLPMGNGSWEIVFKATTGSSTGNNQGLFGITGTGYTRCDTSNNKLRILLSNSSSSFNIGEIASRTLSVNTTYWFKITFTGSSYNMYSSTDGKNYTLDQSISSTAKTTFASGMMIGRARDGVWSGSIDLKESYIKINDKVVWDNKFTGAGTSTDYDWAVDKLVSYAPIVRGSRTYYKQSLKQRDTGTYTFTLNKEYTAKLLFVGNGGGGCSSQKDSQWHYSGGGSGACFEGLVKLPAGTYTLTIGELGYGNNRDNVHYHSSTVVSTDSYLTNSAGQELIRVGAGGNGYTSVGGVSGAAGVLTMGTLNVLETKIARNGNTQVGKTASTNYSLSAYDDTATGYGAGTGAERYEGNVYGIKGIFDLVLETDINDYTYYEDVGTKIY